MNNEGIAQFLEELALELRRGNLYVVDNVWEDQDFETGSLEAKFRSNDADMTKKGQLLNAFKKRYHIR